MREVFLILLLGAFAPLTSSTTTPGPGVVPDCFVDNKQCLVTDETLISSVYGVTDLEDCSKQCQTTADCKAFTLFGTTNIFLSNACLLFESCHERVACKDCVTGSMQQFCTCSIPFEGVKNDENIVKLLPSIPTEYQCKEMCAQHENCKAYTYYKADDVSNPNTCVLLSTAQFTGPATPCEHCVTGPAQCNVGERCKVSSFSTLMVTKSSDIGFISGEKNCYMSVSAVAIGSGGGGGAYDDGLGYWGLGGGSGYIEKKTFNLTSDNPVITVKITTEYHSTTRLIVGGNEVLKAENGRDGSSGHGGDGYSGGGGKNKAGGTNGGKAEDGQMRGGWGKGGKGSGLNVKELSLKSFLLTPGRGGDDSRGGGGGGVLVNGKGPVSWSKYTDEGEGYGGGGGGGNGILGCVLLEEEG